MPRFERSPPLRDDPPTTMTPADDLTEDSEQARPRAPRGAPCLWFTRLPLRELLEVIRRRHFAWFKGTLRLQFAPQDELAECDAVEGGLLLSLHQVLNHAQTPAEVFGTLFKRALWRAGRARRGRADAEGGPAFFTICPEEPFAEAWLDHHLGRCLRRATVDASGGAHEPRVGARWRPLWLAARDGTAVLALKQKLADAELARLLQQLG
jgi:hypothetical protein